MKKRTLPTWLKVVAIILFPLTLVLLLLYYLFRFFGFLMDCVSDTAKTTNESFIAPTNTEDNEDQMR
jgi:hypothetical protein